MTTTSLGYIVCQLLLFSAVGFILGRYFTQHIYPAQRAYPIIRVVIIVGIITALILIRLTTLHVTPDLDRKLQRISLYQALKQQAPTEYAALLAHLEREDTDQEQRTIIQTQALLAPLVSRNLAKTSDDALWAYVRHTTKLARALQQYDGQACYAYTYPQAGLSLPDQYSLAILKQDTTQTETLLDNVLRAYDPQRPAPRHDEFAAAQEAVFARLSRKYGTDVNLLDRAGSDLSDPGEQATACAMLIDIFTWLDERHDAAATATLRYLFDDTLP